MLYRRQRSGLPPWLAASIAALALLAGFLAGRASAPQTTLAGLLRPGQDHVRRASGALEIVPLEFARAKAGNTQSAQAAAGAVQQARTELGQADVLRRLYPGQVGESEAAITALARAISDQAGEAQVRQLVDRGQDSLRFLSEAGR